jgi:hypothetical protein
MPALMSFLTGAYLWNTDRWWDHEWAGNTHIRGCPDNDTEIRRRDVRILLTPVGSQQEIDD